MGMLHSTSGKAGLEYYKSSNIIPRNDLLMILKREDELRHSKEIQEQYSKEFSNGNEYLSHIRDVTENLQKQVLLEFGYSIEALPAFQSHRAYFQDDKEVLQSSVYGRQDIAIGYSNASKFTENIPDIHKISLFTLDGIETSLYELLNPDKLTLLIASSIS